MQAERPAEPADGDEEVDELRLRRQHLGELVDDDEQRRQRREALARHPCPLVVAHRRDVAGVTQQLLPAHHLAGQRVLHPVDQGQLVGEVGDHRRHVRHRRHPGERRPALEVDQHHVELLRRVRQSEPEDQRAQELRLPGAGGADHQAVRPHALLRRLLEVQVDRRPAVAETDRHPQPVARRPGAPGRRRVVPVDVAEPEQVHQVRWSGDLAGAAGLGRDDVQRRQPSGHGLGGREVALVGRGADRGLAQS